MFDPTSRYAAIPTVLHLSRDGRQIPCKQRRLLPASGAHAVVREVTVGPGERLDLIAARHLGDPLAFWRIADANGVLNPFDLTRPGTRLLIPGVHPVRIDKP